MAKRGGITNYSRLGRAALTDLVKKHVENTTVEDQIKIIDRRETLEGVFGTITIEPLQQHLETFFRVRGGTISTIIEHSLKHKKGLKVQLVLKWSW